MTIVVCIVDLISDLLHFLLHDFLFVLHQGTDWLKSLYIAVPLLERAGFH